jgi:hypothetical protein
VKAASLVKTGKTYALGIPVDSKTPAYPPRAFKVTIVQPGQAGIPGLGPSKTTYNDDIIEGWVGVAASSTASAISASSISTTTATSWPTLPIQPA